MDAAFLLSVLGQERMRIEIEVHGVACWYDVKAHEKANGIFLLVESREHRHSDSLWWFYL
jgi:hypothetical protein